MKEKKYYICTNCGTTSSTWLGRCPNCKQWDTFVEETFTQNKRTTSNTDNKIFKLDEIIYDNTQRIPTNIAEFDRVLGGGIVAGSLVLLSGEPGIGKSTLILQVALNIQNKILIVSGEESLNQIKIRSNRLNSLQNNSELYLLSETNIENIINHIDKLHPEIVIVDSIQTLYTNTLDTPNATISQIKQCATILQNYAKQNNITFIIIGHITKDGNIAGPKLLEHIVDTVLQFEGDNNHSFRILRTTKNRFGSTSEIGIFDMTNTGLVEITNPSEILLSSNSKDYSGVAIGTIYEGSRTFLIEIQSLVSTAIYGTPQRNSSTFDIRRLNMLLAILEKKLGLRLTNKDVFLNIAGGLKVTDTSLDLPVLCSIISSDLDIPIAKNTSFIGEISLTGEIRPVQKTENRIVELQKLGFSTVFISKYTKNITPNNFKINIVEVETINDLFKKLFVKK